MVKTRTPVQRRRTFGALALMALALVLTTTQPAFAATGDQTFTINDRSVEFKSNQCSAGWVFTGITGGPVPNPTNLSLLAKGYAQGCVVRARLIFVDASGVRRTTPYIYAYNKGQAGSINYYSVRRCYTEAGVRRTDGTYYTRSMINPNRPNGCGT